MNRLLMLVSVAAIAASSSALAAPRAAGIPGDIGVHTGDSGPRAYRKRNAFIALRDEGLKLKAEDGGTLTDAHRDYLQIKLVRIQHGNY